MSAKTKVLPRWILPVLAALVVLLGGALYLLNQAAEQPGEGSGRALVGGPFSLVDHNGQRVTDADFRGRYMLVFFGYTFCPDVCPVELQTMSQALDQLDEKTAARIQPIFITTDPERDTVEAMAEYVALFHPRLVGLTGNEEEVRNAARAYRVYYQKVEDETSGSYLMDHSAIVFLMGPDGEYVSHFSPGITAEAMATRLAQLVK
ncbi:MAG TPA: SCO family protein [Sphingomonadales bacterium]